MQQSMPFGIIWRQQSSLKIYECCNGPEQTQQNGTWQCQVDIFKYSENHLTPGKRNTLEKKQKNKKCWNFKHIQIFREPSYTWQKEYAWEEEKTKKMQPTGTLNIFKYSENHLTRGKRNTLQKEKFCTIKEKLPITPVTRSSCSSIGQVFVGIQEIIQDWGWLNALST